MTNDEINRKIKQKERQIFLMERDFGAAIIDLMATDPKFNKVMSKWLRLPVALRKERKKLNRRRLRKESCLRG